MKVYELMDRLAQMPAGAEVRIKMLKTLKELPLLDDNLREIDFSLKSVEEVNDIVELDGWAE